MKRDRFMNDHGTQICMQGWKKQLKVNNFSKATRSLASTLKVWRDKANSRSMQKRIANDSKDDVARNRTAGAQELLFTISNVCADRFGPPRSLL